MGKINVLVINACDTLEGDINMLLLALFNFSADDFNIFVVCPPRGAVMRKLLRDSRICLVGMELGGIEAQPAGGRDVMVRLLDFGIAVAKVCKFVQEQHIDVIYTIDRTIAPQIAQMVSRITRRPFVVSAHTAYSTYLTHNSRGSLVLSQLSYVHVHSAHLQSHYMKRGVEKSRIVVIPNAIQLELYDPDESDRPIRSEFNIEQREPVVVMAGRLSPYKGQDILLAAARDIVIRYPYSHFLLAGHDTNEGTHLYGPQEHSFKKILEHMIIDYGLEGRVHLLGHRQDLPAVIAAANVVAMPSWEEPFGLVALEAMAMAKPVVATNVGGVPEFIANGTTGVLIPPKDPKALSTALLGLLGDSNYAQLLGTNARHYVEQHHTAQQYAGRVKQLLYHAAKHKAPTTLTFTSS